ncbi:MAG: hypothetical protein ACK4XY_05390 [Chloroherpetonaceae bacterium]
MIYLFINDMIFQSRVENELRNLDLKGKFVKSVDEVQEIGKNTFAIFDLSEPTNLDNLKKFREKFSQVKTLAFLPHVNEELKQKAVSLGCSSVMARFEFTKNMRAALQGKWS